VEVAKKNGKVEFIFSGRTRKEGNEKKKRKIISHKRQMRKLLCLEEDYNTALETWQMVLDWVRLNWYCIKNMEKKVLNRTANNFVI
jgi:hypothetical protein